MSCLTEEQYVWILSPTNQVANFEDYVIMFFEIDRSFDVHRFKTALIYRNEN